MLKSEELLDVHEVLETIIVDLQTLNGELALEGVWLELSYLVVVYV
jgi:hypothetical protein